MPARVQFRGFGGGRRGGHKYNAQRTTVGGHAFASKAEARRYEDLLVLQKARLIGGLELQPRFKVVIDGVLICTYVADFRYRNGRGKNAPLVVEDVKGVRTPVYKLKKKLVEVVLGIAITEI